MRRTLVAGLVLALAAVLVVLVSSGLDLELESVALLGGALGAVVALVPDRTPLVRLSGFAGGFVAAWVGYVVRAALLPDTAGGRAVAVGLVLALAAVLVVLVSSGLDLELESVALLGGALGAVVALVPDRTPLVRLSGFAGGFVAAWVGYVVRAALLPDTAGGRAVAVGLV